jgi:hypothetical protein
MGAFELVFVAAHFSAPSLTIYPPARVVPDEILRFL